MNQTEESASGSEPELPILPAVPGLSVTGTGGVQVEFTGEGGDLSAKVVLPGHKDPDQEHTVVAGGKPLHRTSEPVETTSVGRTFGGYSLVRKIGQGGMGQVWQARQVSLDRVVAIKILNKAIYDNDEFIKRFQREAKSIARINHPNIVAVYDFGQQDGQWYMVNEFVEGSALAKVMADKLIVPAGELVPLICHCLAGLAHVAQMGIVHRDIKPDNILITKDGIAKIADFGLAKDVSSKDDHTDLTGVGLAMGTPAYMSPEQCIGRKLDARSDIYSLGVTAYFALTGHKPFTGQSSFEIMTKQRELLPPPPHQLIPYISRPLSEVIMKMMAKAPEDRFGDPEECRLAWLEIGREMGLMGGVFDTGSERRSNRQPAASSPLPAISAPAPAPLPTIQAQNGPAASSSSPMQVQPPGEARPSADVRASGVQQAEGVARGSERQGKPGTDRKHPAATSSQVSDARTCQRCGMLNRGDAMSCARCGSSLTRPDAPMSRAAQEAEAIRLHDQRRYLDAANLWGRMAEAEQDKRNRSVLRSREREARRQAQEQQVAEIIARVRGLSARGNLRDGIAQLEQLRQGLESPDPVLDQTIFELRARLRLRRHLFAAVVILVLILGTLGGLWWLFATVKPGQPVTPPASGTR